MKRSNYTDKIRRTIVPVLLAAIWISISEFVRNEFIVKKLFWTNHYQSLGLTFPSDPVNGAVWGIWSLLFAIVIFILSKKLNLIKTTLISCFCRICSDVGCFRKPWSVAIRTFTLCNSFESDRIFSCSLDNNKIV